VNAPFAGNTPYHSFSLHRDKEVRTAAKQEREPRPERGISIPPVKPEVGPFPIVNLMFGPKFEIPFDLLDGLPKLRPPFRDILVEQIPIP
jgi:hypothetical protein